MRYKTGWIFLLSLFPLFLEAQQATSDSALIAGQVHRIETAAKSGHSVHLQKTYNPVKGVLFLAMYVYQSLLSEQISAQCEFDRSCSGFSLAAIRELGIIKGICLSADRLTRCNGQSQTESYNYLINHSNGKTIDEPSMYRFRD